MIAGHLGIAGAVYAARRGSSLPWLLVAAMAPDGVDALFVLAGICNPHGLYSHTIPAAVLIAAGRLFRSGHETPAPAERFGACRSPPRPAF